MPSIELEADEFSGFALRKMGASLSEAQVAMRIIAGARATRTHPARTDRLMAIATGWNRADEQLSEENIAGREVDPHKAEPLENPVLPKKYIAFDVHFSFDPDVKYHVTKGNNLVKLFDNRLQVLGKLLPTGKRAYPLAFHTTSKDFLFISTTGKIFNKHGETLGYITARK